MTNLQSDNVIILGAGPGGMSAAWWCRELGLTPLVLERSHETGGQLRRIFNPIHNYLGLRAANGAELGRHFAAHFASAQIETRLSATITAVDLSRPLVQLADNTELAARALILATGVRRRRLGIPGETELAGRGIIESGMRDRAGYNGKKVCVIGGGDAAAENALLLAEAGAQVLLVHRGAQLRAREEFVARLRANPRISVVPRTVALSIHGTERVEAIELNRQGALFTEKVSGVLARIGVTPNTELFRAQLETDANGYIAVNARQQTTVAQVFAVGDCANPTAPTIAGAVGAGAMAAKVLAASLKV